MVELKSFQERRAHFRKPVKISVDYHLVEDPAEIKNLKSQTADTRDLSLEGVYIHAGRLNVKDVIRMDISIPKNPNSIFAFAEVVRIDQTGAGLRLMLMASEDKESLRGYLETAPST
jgi:hypothetical protein